MDFISLVDIEGKFKFINDEKFSDIKTELEATAILLNNDIKNKNYNIYIEAIDVIANNNELLEDVFEEYKYITLQDEQKYEHKMIVSSDFCIMENGCNIVIPQDEKDNLIVIDQNEINNYIVPNGVEVDEYINLIVLGDYQLNDAVHRLINSNYESYEDKKDGLSQITDFNDLYEDLLYIIETSHCDIDNLDNQQLDSIMLSCIDLNINENKVLNSLGYIRSTDERLKWFDSDSISDNKYLNIEDIVHYKHNNIKRLDKELER